MSFLQADIPVLFCDEALLVIYKPAGLSTLPDGYDPSLPHIRALLESQYGRLWIVHRLDKETSGVLCLARSADAHRSLNTQFEQRLVSKIYHALVAGTPVWQEKTVDLPLRINADRRHRTVVDPQNGLLASTSFTVLERLGSYSLLQAIPATGRTHQIRAHLAALGLVIVGDRLYARKSPAREAGGEPVSQLPTDAFIDQVGSMLLQALSLEITHPIIRQRIKFTAPYTDKMIAILQQLRSQY
ncbi:MAG: RluA family pseudouridine synthase [Anaerolineae bacterium]|nr:RluA family pseudouridine synthase [Anaerolineae bacterium]